MGRNKYIYHHFVNGVETTKEQFIDKLQSVCVRCDTNYDNPLMNIGCVDYDLVKRRYDYFKCHPRTTTHYIRETGSISFRIDRKLKVVSPNKCCFCGEEIVGFGNNPYPADKQDNARCCDRCNAEIVIPARLKEAYGRKEK